jgi:hypothetical protein
MIGVGQQGEEGRLAETSGGGAALTDRRAESVNCNRSLTSGCTMDEMLQTARGVNRRGRLCAARLRSPTNAKLRICPCLGNVAFDNPLGAITPTPCE